MNCLCDIIKKMASNGYCVAWNSSRSEFWPCFAEDCDLIQFIHDPSGCNTADFEVAVKRTYQLMLDDIEKYGE